MKEKIQFNVIPAILSFLLLAVAIRPFCEANQLTPYSYLILYVIACIFICSFLQEIYLRIPFYLLAISLICYSYFPLNTPFSFQWVRIYIQSCLNSLLGTSQQTNGSMPESLALLMVVVLLIFFIKLLLEYQQWKLPFFLLLAYFLTLTVYNNENLFFETLLLLIVSAGFSFWDQIVLEDKQGKFRKNLILLSICFIFPLFVAWVIPNYLTPIQNVMQTKTYNFQRYLRTAGFYQKFSREDKNTKATSGFSENDSTLGGPLQLNNQTVFTVEQKTPHYWRVETKNVYTGLGWENTPSSSVTIQDSSLSIQNSVNEKLDFENKEELVFHFPNQKNYLPIAYGQIHWEIPTDLIQYKLVKQDSTKNRIYLDEKKTNTLQQINYTLIPLSYTESDLDQADFQSLTSQFLTEYTQLPKNLPNDIHTLALNITKDASTTYQKAKAIESYLKSSGNYRYSVSETPFVPDGKDYVDYFLFTSKVGYCDNFSSSMVVLLRSLGIPSRWAKGFSSGNEISRNYSDGSAFYRITNADAHSWPEVYFSEIGWVPFEPTTYFTQSLTAETATTTTPSESSTPKSSENNEYIPASTQETQESTAQAEEVIGTTETTTIKETRKNSQINQTIRSILFLLFFVFALLILLARNKIYYYFSVWKATVFLNKSFKKSYLYLVKKVEKKTTRNKEESLRHFSHRMETELPTLESKFSDLTQTYETMLYGKNSDRKILPKEKSTITYILQVVLRKK